MKDNVSGKRLIAVTGATGTMGSASIRELLKYPDLYKVRILVRDSKKNRKKIESFRNVAELEVIWGDLLDFEAVKKLIRDADVVLHIGGIVSPKADWYPEKTLKVNIGSAKNIVEAIESLNQNDSTSLVYIGSVAQYGPRAVPDHWAGPGDPMNPALYDMYALSKIEAERIVAESNIKRWVSLRQSGILSPAILFNGTDPISFHVPVNGVLEWATVEDSARLMERICRPDVPEEVWGDFFDISSGKDYRLTNYEFECMLLKALSCPPPEKVFEPYWFALRNFHGVWYWSADRLQTLLPFRAYEDPVVYFNNLSKTLPLYFKLAAFVPAALIKFGMKQVAKREKLGTLWWRKTGDERLKAYFGPISPLTEWSAAVTPRGADEEKDARMLDIGYDRHIDRGALTLADMQNVAKRRGGECLSETMTTGDLRTPLRWRCGRGHEFKASPSVVALGGHWCPECGYWPDADRLNTDPLLRDAYLSTHLPSEL